MIHQVLKRLANKPPASVRGRAWRNLLMATVNAALGRRLITLDRQPFDDTSFEFELAGLPVLAMFTAQASAGQDRRHRQYERSLRRRR